MIASAAAALELERVDFWLPPAEGPLLERIRSALAERAGQEGEPLRWAITAADPRLGLRLEAVLLRRGGTSP